MRELKSLYGGGLNYDNINFSDYFRTLSAEGKRQKMLSEEKFDTIKTQVGEILTRLISDYNGNESTSIMKDTANDIFDSLMYTLDIALFTFECHEDALEYILENDVSDVYKKGLKTIKQLMFECVSYVVKLRSARINFTDISYNKLIDEDVLNYLKKYNVKFFAHGTKRVFLYNSVNGCGGYRGVLHLKRFLENLIKENAFVNQFGEDEIQQLCYGYCEKNNREYNDMGANIYSVVLTNAIFANIAGKNGIEVTKEDANFVSKLLKKLNENEQRRIIIDAAKEISSESYIQNSAVRLAGHIINSVNKNELNIILYVGEVK